MRYAIAFILMLCAIPAQAALVTSNKASCTGVETCSVTLSGVPAGAAIGVAYYQLFPLPPYTPDVSFTVIDSSMDSYLDEGGSGNDYFNYDQLRALSVAGGNVTITVTITGSPLTNSTWELMAAAVTGVTGVSAEVDAEFGGTATTSAFCSTGVLLLKWGANSMGSLMSSDPDITIIQTSSILVMGYTSEPSSGTYSTTWTGTPDGMDNYFQIAAIMGMLGGNSSGSPVRHKAVVY